VTDVSAREIGEALRAFHWERQRELREKWNRSVPFGDAVVDRWERAKFLGFGEGSSVYDSALILGDVTVGRKTWVGPSAILDGSGGLSIGDYCSVSAGVQIYTHDSVKWALTGGLATYDYAPVSIGSNSYIGPMTIVAKGVRIGRHCLVGANSLVNRDLDDYSIAFGTPCKVVGRVEVRDGEVELVYAQEG
jgi:acetyltransferase-like isoleucine patch superfamily enzyme